MGIIWVEVCVISARGLQSSTSLWKRPWFAVGWIDHDSKYCTKVDASEDANPVWRTKFAIPVDDSATNLQDLVLNVEVYSIDPIFLAEKLHGSAKVVLQEFLAKQAKNSEVSKPRHEEFRSYQLRKKKSSKPRGFVDISIRVSEEKKEPNSHSGSKGGKVQLDHSNDTRFITKGGLGQAYQQKQPQDSFLQEENHNFATTGGLGQAYLQKQPQDLFRQEENHVQINAPNYYSEPFPTKNYSDPYEDEKCYLAAAGPSYQPSRTRTPPPPPPPSNVGYIPTFLPINDCLPSSYTDMTPPRAAPRRRGPPGFAMGLGAGALAAGALIFGDDFMSGFDVPPCLEDDCRSEEDDDPPF